MLKPYNYIQMNTIPLTRTCKSILIAVYFFIGVHKHAFSQIPNSDFENWQWIGGWYENPDEWTTNNAQLSSIEVGKDTNAYQGNYAMKLKNYNTYYRAWAQIKFPIATHPFKLIGYVKCRLADNADTVSIKITLLNNGLQVDSGVWLGTSSISNYIQIKIPLSQNTSIIDSAIIVITGGSHLTNNQPGMGTEFWLDNLSLDFTNGVQNLKKNESQFNIFPNPASQYVMIEFTGEIHSSRIIGIKLYDIIGKEIKIIENKELLNGNKQSNIDLSFLPNGLYFMELKTNQEIEFKKIIKN